MTKKPLFATLRVASAALLSVAGVMAVSACEERSYSSPTHSAPPPAQPPADLMGAPDRGSPYTAPPVYQQPAYSQPAYSQPLYDSGSVVAMAPIPNPGDPGSGPYYGDRRYDGARVHARYSSAAPTHEPENTATSPYGEGHPAPGHHPAPARTPVYAKATAAPKATAAYPPTLAPVAANGRGIEHKSVAVAAAVGASALALNAKPATHTAVQADKAKAATPTAPTSAAPTPVAAPAGDRATRLASLQTALTDAVGKTAILVTPTPFTANQPADVSLTLPVGFGDTLKSEAQKDGLGDAAASVNMTALLSGAGFAVTPQDTQASQLIAGQPTVLRWTVTAQPGAKGPLHADVGADLLGGGSDKLALGSVQKASDMGVKLTPHLIGAALLVLIAALVVAWLARGRGPTRSIAARRASRGAFGQSSRPLDIDATPVDEKPAK